MSIEFAVLESSAMFREFMRELERRKGPRTIDRLIGDLGVFCRLVEWPADVSDHARMMVEGNMRFFVYVVGICRIYADHKSDTLHAAVQSPGLVERLSEIMQYVRYSRASHSNPRIKEIMSELETKHYALIVAALAAVGYAAFRFIQAMDKEPTLDSAKRAPDGLKTSGSSWVAVFVIRASEVDSLESIISGDIAHQDLYRATTAMWYGNADDYKASPVSSCVDAEGSAQQLDSDVVYVEFILETNVPDLSAEAKTMARKRAFEALLAQHKGVRISNRQRSKSFGGKGFYDKMSH